MLLGKKVEHSPIPHIHKLNSNSSFAMQESYKTIRTNIQFALAGSTSNSVVFSSSIPSEGKSITCANVAITMAQMDKKVLIIDADLRKPTQHRIFRVDNTSGLSSMLVGFSTLGNSVRRNVEKNLDLMTSGPIPPNPSEILGSDRMDKLLNELGKYYDYIFIDTPPVNVVTDGVLLAAKSSGVIIVSRQNMTTYDEVQKAINAFNVANAKILGVIVNDVQKKHRDKSYYEQYK